MSQADSSFISWFLGNPAEPRPLVAASDENERRADTATAALSESLFQLGGGNESNGTGSESSASAAAAAVAVVTSTRAKTSSELMLDDAVRWVLWQHARRALNVDADAMPAMTFARLTLGAQQWLIQFTAGRRLSQSAAAQLWHKHDPTKRGWINASAF